MVANAFIHIGIFATQVPIHILLAVQPIPDGIFVVGACNPHRGNSVILHERNKLSDTWIRGTYYVHRLHPTIHLLKLDYGALTEVEEGRYVEGKLRMLQEDTAS